MATRFYLPSTGAADISPAFEAEWTENASADRLLAVRTRISSAMADVERALSVSAGTRLIRQYVSVDSIKACILTTGTIKGTIRVKESATNDNIMQVTCSIRIVDSTGNTFRTPALLAKGQWGPSNEWSNSSRIARRIADGDSISQVQCYDGDRVVIELGYYVSSGISISGLMVFGDDSGTNLGDNETDTAAYNPFVEYSGTIPFLITLTGAVSGSGSVTGSVSVIRGLSGSLSGSGSLTGDVSRLKLITGSVEGSGAIAGDVSVIRGLAGAFAGTGDLAGEVTRLKLITAVLEGSGSLAGSISGIWILAGQMSGSGSLAGEITVITGQSFVLLTGSFSGAGGLAGEIALIRGLDGGLSGSADLAGQLALTLDLTGSFEGEGDLTGDITVFTAGEIVELEGAMQGSGSLAGSVSIVSGRVTWSARDDVGTTTLTIPGVKVNDGPAPCLTVRLANRIAAATVVSVAWGSKDLSEHASLAGAGCRASYWYGVGLTPGTEDVVVTFSQSTKSVGFATVTYAIDQVTPVGSAFTATGTGTAPAVNVTNSSPVIGDTLVEDVVAVPWSSAQTIEADGSQTEDGNDVTIGGSPGDNIQAGASREAPAVNPTPMTWTISTSAEWVIVATYLRPAIVYVSFSWIASLAEMTMRPRIADAELEARIRTLEGELARLQRRIR